MRVVTSPARCELASQKELGVLVALVCPGEPAQDRVWVSVAQLCKHQGDRGALTEDDLEKESYFPLF